MNEEDETNQQRERIKISLEPIHSNTNITKRKDTLATGTLSKDRHPNSKNNGCIEMVNLCGQGDNHHGSPRVHPKP